MAIASHNRQGSCSKAAAQQISRGACGRLAVAIEGTAVEVVIGGHLRTCQALTYAYYACCRWSGRA